MTSEEQERRADLRRQAHEFARAGGYGQQHNRKPGGDRIDRSARNRKSRRKGARKTLRSSAMPWRQRRFFGSASTHTPR
jgi:hypothetical protein